MMEVSKEAVCFEPQDEAEALRWERDWQHCEGASLALKSAFYRHRQSALATTRAELAALEARCDTQAEFIEKTINDCAILEATIHQLGENAAKAAGEYAERVAAIRRELALTELANIEGVSDEWLDGFRHAVSRVEATLALDTLNVSNLARAALTEPTDEG